MRQFKKGDRVRIIDNTSSSSNKVGDIGIITTEPSGMSQSVRVTVDGREDTCNWTRPKDIELVERGMPNEIRVPSLDFEVLYKDGSFLIGCQKVSFEDANKVADFIKAQVEKPKLTFRKGDILVEADGRRYLVAQPTPNDLVFICLRDGHRWTDPVEVYNVYSPTQKEIALLVGSGTFTKESKCK